MRNNKDLLAGIFSLLQPFGYISPSNGAFMALLLFCYKDLSDEVDRSILQLTLQFIHKTGQVDHDISKLCYMPPKRTDR